MNSMVQFLDVLNEEDFKMKNVSSMPQAYISFKRFKNSILNMVTIDEYMNNIHFTERALFGMVVHGYNENGIKQLQLIVQGKLNKEEYGYKTAKFSDMMNEKMKMIDEKSNIEVEGGK